MVYLATENRVSEEGLGVDGHHLLDGTVGARLVVRRAPCSFAIVPGGTSQVIQLAVPRSAEMKISLDSGRAGFTLSSPGVVAVNPGVAAGISVKRGTVYELAAGTVPAWYEPYVPGSNFEWVRDKIAPFFPGGYDRGGLCWEWGNGAVVAYEHGSRTNLWTGAHDDWMSSSIMCAGRSGAFVNGISRVCSVAGSASPIPAFDFHQIRKCEQLHQHPVRDGVKMQVEVYCIHEGRTALFCALKGRPFVLVLEAGDIAIVRPTTIHSLVAVATPYEHLAIQLPSTFQYGFWFKENVRWETLGFDAGCIIERGEELIAGPGHGLFEVS